VEKVETRRQLAKGSSGRQLEESSSGKGGEYKRQWQGSKETVGRKNTDSGKGGGKREWEGGKRGQRQEKTIRKRERIQIVERWKQGEAVGETKGTGNWAAKSQRV
jgi:hypothetical protein